MGEKLKDVEEERLEAKRYLSDAKVSISWKKDKSLCVALIK